MSKSSVIVLRQMLRSYLDGSGGISSTCSQNVPSILEIMESCTDQDEKILIIQTFRSTRCSGILTRIMETGGWDQLYDWLLEANSDADEPMLEKLLQLYSEVPVSMEIFKINGCVGEIKRLRKFQNERIARMAESVFQAWKAYKTQLDNGTVDTRSCTGFKSAIKRTKMEMPIEKAKVSESSKFVEDLLDTNSKSEMCSQKKKVSSSSSAPAESTSTNDTSASSEEGSNGCPGTAFLDGLLSSMSTLVSPRANPRNLSTSRTHLLKWHPVREVLKEKQLQWDKLYSEEVTKVSENSGFLLDMLDTKSKSGICTRKRKATTPESAATSSSPAATTPTNDMGTSLEEAQEELCAAPPATKKRRGVTWDEDLVKFRYFKLDEALM